MRAFLGLIILIATIGITVGLTGAVLGQVWDTPVVAKQFFTVAIVGIAAFAFVCFISPAVEDDEDDDQTD